MSSSDGEKREFDVEDPTVTKYDLVREGARRDGVEIVHYAPRFPVPGTKVERRVERVIALLFLLAGAAGLGFLIAYIWWPWEYTPGNNSTKYYTPVLGVTLAITLLGIGFGAITFAKKLLPDEIAVEKRHIGGSSSDEQKLTGASITHILDDTGISRRPLLKGALTLGLLPVAGIAVVPLVGGLIKDPHHPDIMFRTGFDPANNNGHDVPLVREDGTPVRPEDVSVGGQITVFPGIPGGTTNQYADSPTLLIHLRDADAALLREQLYEINKGSMYENYVAYSKICSHLGCPASLYEQQTNRLLCPCHQSQFLITDNAKPIFGPASRRLPMLPIKVDPATGFFVAAGDYKEAIGPSFWERP